MPAPANAKQPTDRKPKTSALDEVPECFTFELDNGESITLKPTGDELTPGFIRKNRNSNEADVTYLMIERLAGEPELEAIDNMSWTEHGRFHKEFGEHINAFMGVSMGESSAS